tara:strand:+ start:364 stop:1356 length:993 start_codon:yes stop_codon:yes gene_type:complete
MKKQVLSLIQPSGELHLGNYLGAIKNWVKIQDEYICTYGIANYHPMTIPYEPITLKDNSIKMALDLYSCGVKPENLFLQSLVPEHTELCWVLGCVTSYGELTRQTQYKEKSKRVSQEFKDQIVSAGLFTYPVLQAADILIYKADFVPVGKDQEQHLELARNVAIRFNNQFNVDYFPEPSPLYTEIPKVKSTADPTKKMSKSLTEKHWIGVFEGKEEIYKKIRSAKTDMGSESKMSDGVKNLFTLLKTFNENVEIVMEYEQLFNSNALKYTDLKQAVFDSIISKLEPIRTKRIELESKKIEMLDVLKESSFQIQKKARQTLLEVKDIVGLY